ncbi:S8 family serine peptidase [Candidatus Saccharibacteria bacterium]|nr:S8 family serine peptidase [Candidatus Saccharibacteria bacterium]
MRRNLEIPQGKRTPKYRFFEILPGAISYGAIILLFLLSWFDPVLGAIYLFIVITTTLVKAVGTAFRTVQGYNVLKRAMRVDWHGRVRDLTMPHEAYERIRDDDNKSYHFEEHVENLKYMAAMPADFVDPLKVYQLVLVTAYDENLEVLTPTIEAVKNTGFDNARIIVTLAYEERGGLEMEKTAQELKKKYAGVFYDFTLVKHPANLPGEVIGKGPNLTYAGQKMAEYVRERKLPVENIIVTTLDSDNHVHEKYFDAVTYEFVTHPNRQRLSYQPVSLFMNNIWDAPAPSRVIALSNSFFNVISTMRPHALRNFASHSQPLQALEAMGFWSKRTIVEDGHQYWRSLFFFGGNYAVLPIRIPIYQDAVIGESFWKTVKAQFVQVRRWYYGASDVAYVGVRLFTKKEQRPVPFIQLLPKFWRLLDGHVTLAILAPIVAFGGWVPGLMNMSAHTMVGYNLPNIVSVVETFASVGLIVSILVSFRMLPRRPSKYRRGRVLLMLLQWILMPVTSILYQSLAAFYAQTRLMLGKYMEKFDVTKKVIKKSGAKVSAGIVAGIFMLGGFLIIKCETVRAASYAEIKAEMDAGEVEDKVLTVTEDAVMTNRSWGTAIMGLREVVTQVNAAGKGSELKIAIIDTGANVGDVDTVGSLKHDYPTIRLELYDVASGETSAEAVRDLNGHGTHIAGTIAEALPQEATLMIIRAAEPGDGSRNMYLARVLDAIEYAAINGADVINMSFGTDEKIDILETYLNTAAEMGVVSLAASGNDGKRKDFYPASFESVISVGSVGVNMARAGSSNYGPTLEFVAPGVNILSINGLKSGTSMATPHVTAAVGLIKSYNNALGLDAVRELLSRHVIDLGAKGRDDEYGYGMVSLAGVRMCENKCDEYRVFETINDKSDAEIVDKTGGAAATQIVDGALMVESARACVVIAENVKGEFAVVGGEAMDGTWRYVVSDDALKMYVVLKGDVNMNGKVNVNDSAMINLSLLGSDSKYYRELAEMEKIIADVNRNGKINVNDSAVVNLSLLDKSNKFYRELAW